VKIKQESAKPREQWNFRPSRLLVLPPENFLLVWLQMQKTEVKEKPDKTDEPTKPSKTL
jgi:hypothetical protein